MANNPKLLAAFAKDMLDASADPCSLLNSGFIDIYSGAQPAGPSAGVGGATKLAHIPLSATAFAAVASNARAANGTPLQDTNAPATGTAAWARITKSDGTAEIDCTVGTASCDINLASTSIVAGQTVSITSFSVSLNSIVG